jgi:hypothetical protein
MDTTRVPETTNEAVTAALDLDRDGQPDNALGGLLAAMHGAFDVSIAADQMALVEAGRILELVGIDAASLDDATGVPVLVSRGADLDGDAADNFSGAEPFALEPLGGADGQLTGVLASGRLSARRGTIPILLAVFGVEPQVVALRAVGGRIRAEAAPEALADGRHCGGLPEAEVDDVLIPAMATGVGDIVERDCTADGCQPDSQGETLVEFFDENADYMVTAEEFRDNSLIQSTVGNPDLDLLDAAGEYDPNVDGVKDSLSLCLAFTAVPARVIE